MRWTLKKIPEKEKIDKLRELSPLWEMFKEGVDLEKVEWAEH